MSITRIQNNQITDSTIVAYAKLQSGSLTGNLFAPTVTLNSNVTINGNLFLANTGNTATINATNTYINDPIVVFNNGYVGSLSGYDIGMLINRNLSPLGSYGSVNTAWVWSENDQAFEAIATTDTGTGIASINNSGWANIKIGNSTITGSESISGALTVTQAATLNGTTTINGAATFNSTATFAYTTQVNSTLGATGIVSFTNATNNSGLAFNSGALQVTGGTGIGGNLYVGGNITLAGNINTSTGNINLVSVTGNSAQFFGNAAGFGALYAGINSGFVYQAQTVLQNSTNFNGYAQVNHQNINNGAQATTDYVLTADTGTANTNYVDLGIASSGYVNTNPNNSLGTSLYPLDGYLYVQSNVAGSPGGNLTVGTSIPGTVVRVLVGGVNIANVVTTYTSSGLTVNSATASSSTTSGALQVIGGVGVGGAINAGQSITAAGNVNVNGGGLTTTQTTGYLFNSSATTLNVGAAATTLNLGATTGTATIANPTLVGSQATQNVYNTVATTVNAFGAATALNIGASTGTLTIGNPTITATNATALNLNGASPAIATTSTGTASVFNTNATTLNIGGAATAVSIGAATGNTTVNSANLVVVGNLFVSGTTTTTYVNKEVITGSEVVGGILYANSNTPSTSTTSGALQITGGAGITQNVYVGGLLNVAGNITTTANAFVGNLIAGPTNGNPYGKYYATVSDHSNPNNNWTAGGMLIDLTNGGGLYVSRSTASPTPIHSRFDIDSVGLNIGTVSNHPVSFFVNGSSGLVPASMKLDTTGNLIIVTSTASTSTTTGALVVGGGVGIAGSINAGGNVAVNAGGLTTTQTTAYVFNEAASTVAAFSAATSIGVGATSGTFTINNPTLVGTQTTQNLYNTTATTLNFAGAATTLNIGAASGSVTFNNPVVVGTSATQSLFNTAASTINFAGAATTLNIGNAAGTNNLSGVLNVGGNIVATAASVNTRFSSTTGALIVPNGGAGIAGNTSVGGSLFVGTALKYTPANGLVQVGYNVNNYSQFAIQNASNGNNASTDIAAVADNGSDNDTYIDMGITGSGYNQSQYSLYKPNDGYIVVAGNLFTRGGNLILNTYNANDIIFATGGTTKQFEVARITSGNVLIVKSINNASPGANVGAFQVWGGESISGNSYIGGATTFNGSQTAGNDVITRGNNDSTLIWARPNSTYDTVLLGGSATAANVVNGAKLNINSTDSILLPSGTSVQRPGTVGFTDVAGMIRYNTTLSSVEFYSGTQWVQPGVAYTVITDAQFSGTGSQTAFTLPSSQTTNSCIVSINGIVQIPTLAYSVSGTTLTFTEAPVNGDVIDIRMLTTTSTITNIADTTGYISVTAVTGSGLQITTGTVATGQQLQYTINNAGAIVTNSPNVTVATSGVATTVDSFYSNTYSSAKYLVTSTIAGTNIREVAEVLVVTDNVSAYVSAYQFLRTAGNSLSAFSATLTGGSVNLQATTTNNNTILRIKRDYQAV